MTGNNIPTLIHNQSDESGFRESIPKVISSIVCVHEMKKGQLSIEDMLKLRCVSGTWKKEIDDVLAVDPAFDWSWRWRKSSEVANLLHENFEKADISHCPSHHPVTIKSSLELTTFIETVAENELNYQGSLLPGKSLTIWMNRNYLSYRDVENFLVLVGSHVWNLELYCERFHDWPTYFELRGILEKVKNIRTLKLGGHEGVVLNRGWLEDQLSARCMMDQYPMPVLAHFIKYVCHRAISLDLSTHLGLLYSYSDQLQIMDVNSLLHFHLPQIRELTVRDSFLHHDAKGFYEAMLTVGCTTLEKLAVPVRRYTEEMFSLSLYLSFLNNNGMGGVGTPPKQLKFLTLKLKLAEKGILAKEVKRLISNYVNNVEITFAENQEFNSSVKTKSLHKNTNSSDVANANYVSCFEIF